MRPAQARSVRGSGFRVLSCRAEGPVRVPVTGAVRRIARHGRRAAPSARARRSPADEPGHAARPLARHRVFVTSRAARRGAARASTTIHETHAYASPTQRKPSALRYRGRFVAFLWDGSDVKYILSINEISRENSVGFRAVQAKVRAVVSRASGAAVESARRGKRRGKRSLGGARRGRADGPRHADASASPRTGAPYSRNAALLVE